MFEHDTREDEYDHAYENVAEDEIPDRGGSLRVAVWVISAVIAIVTIALPLVRVFEWTTRDSEIEVASSETQSLVARRFAEAVLVQRSTTQALRWALPDLRDEIEAIVGELNRRPASELAGASGGVVQVICEAGFAEGSQCFHAWLRRPIAFEFIRILIVVNIADGNPIVIAIRRVNVV